VTTGTLLKVRRLTARFDAAGLARWIHAFVPEDRRAAVIERLLLEASAAPVQEPEGTTTLVSAEGDSLQTLDVVEMASTELVVGSEQRSWMLPAEHLYEITTTAPDTALAGRIMQDLGAREIDLRWPADASPREVVDWLTAHAPDQAIAQQLCGLIRDHFGFEPAEKTASTSPKRGRKAVSPVPAPASVVPTPPLFLQASLAARAFVVWRAIERDLARPMIAVDASQPHHDLMAGWRDLPKNIGRRNERKFRRRIEPSEPGGIERLEILAPDGRAIQLTLQIDGSTGLHHAIVETLRQWQGPEGIRHWAAMQRLFSVEGGRTGAVRWTLETHLAALGYADRHRRNPAVRRRVASQVEALTRLELAVYAPDGKLRARAPLIAVTTKYDALHGSEWALEGMELRVNEWLYRGVRNPETGELGSYWYPAPIELALIDHGKYPYAIVLGLILPMRWRWDLGERDYCALKGVNLLATAGIRYSHHDPGRSWETLRNNLEELQQRGGLGRYEWEDGAWTLNGVCRLYPPQSARDRTLHGLRPQEQPPPQSVMTGGELVAWRKARGWSQADTARALGVSVITVKRAERDPKTPLGKALRTAIGTSR
jgi:DNA-binding XRE family transcriptional regulator